MPKRGNWGDWAVIDLPKTEIKKVSCYACSFYYEEDGSCLKTPIIPHVDNNKNEWKNCKYFELDSKYMTNSFMESVKNVKGKDFFSSDDNSGMHVGQKRYDHIKADSLLMCDYEIGSWIKSDTFGKGRLVDVYPGKVVIDFQGKTRKFLYPQAFDDCKLFLVHEPTITEDLETTLDVNNKSDNESLEYEVETTIVTEMNMDVASEEKHRSDHSDYDQMCLNEYKNDTICDERNTMAQSTSDLDTSEKKTNGNKASIFTKGIKWVKKIFLKQE